jgi:hypothetical protein
MKLVSSLTVLLCLTGCLVTHTSGTTPEPPLCLEDAPPMNHTMTSPIYSPYVAVNLLNCTEHSDKAFVVTVNGVVTIDERVETGFTGNQDYRVGNILYLNRFNQQGEWVSLLSINVEVVNSGGQLKKVAYGEVQIGPFPPHGECSPCGPCPAYLPVENNLYCE